MNHEYFDMLGAPQPGRNLQFDWRRAEGRKGTWVLAGPYPAIVKYSSPKGATKVRASVNGLDLGVHADRNAGCFAVEAKILELQHEEVPVDMEADAYEVWKGRVEAFSKMSTKQGSFRRSRKEKDDEADGSSDDPLKVTRASDIPVV